MTATDPSPDASPIVLSAAGGAGERVDRFLARTLEGVSRARIQHWIALGAVRCEQRVLAPKTRLGGFEEIVVEPQPREADKAFVAEPVAFPVRHEDEDVIVIAKPAGLVVHPGAGNWQGTLMNGLLHRYPDSARLPRAGIVHRLDKDTSGLMVVARSERAFEALVAQLSQRQVVRRYLALAWGDPGDARTLDGPIGRDPSHRLRMAVRPDGKPARTDVSVLGRGCLEGAAVSLVSCRLHTGRTHQIRVHLAQVGCPLVGDGVYGGRAGGGFAAQALHAFALRFAHPGGGNGGPFVEAPPAPWAQALAQAGIDFPLASDALLALAECS